MIRKGQRPGLRFGLPGSARGGLHRAFPFRRSWVAIGILAAMDVVFLIPAVITFRQAAGEWGHIGSLFDLVGALFLSAWLLGWIIGPLLMTGILAILLFGREAASTRPGVLEVFIGLPFFGLSAVYDTAKIRNLRFVEGQKKGGRAWRGSHLAFDYGANTVALGSDLSPADVEDIQRYIEAANGGALRGGEASRAELEQAWGESVAELPGSPPEPPPPESVRPARPLTLASPSTLALVAANLLPLAGTVLWGWNLSDVMVLYWAESAVVGLFTIFKMIVIGRWAAALFVPFFIGHFGGFMAVHFLFIYMIFVEGLQSSTVSGGDLHQVAQMFVDLWPALAALFVSHAYSFFHNFIGRQEWRNRTLKQQMMAPYSRILFMHLVLIFGGGLALILGGTTPVLIGVIALKIVFDVRAHLKEHT